MFMGGFGFIVASALFHVLWNSFLKHSQDRSVALTLMMIISVVLTLAWSASEGTLGATLLPETLLTALVAGFFFFLYQSLIALAYGRGQMSQLYPLSITGPLYIAIWSFLLLGERVSAIGLAGIAMILYGAICIQLDSFRLRFGPLLARGARESGALAALGGAFFYSFGAIADKIGVTQAPVSAYTADVCLAMLGFHILWQLRSGARMLPRLQCEWSRSTRSVLIGGATMGLSFMSFRIGLQDIPASYASALRQVSALFGVGMGFFIFRESFGIVRLLSALLIAMGAALIKLG